MPKIIQRFGKRSSFHLQGDYVTVGHFWKRCVGHTVGGALDLMVLLGEAKECFQKRPALTYSPRRG
jgi:hypothetical protein